MPKKRLISTTPEQEQKAQIIAAAAGVTRMSEIYRYLIDKEWQSNPVYEQLLSLQNKQRG